MGRHRGDHVAISLFPRLPVLRAVILRSMETRDPVAETEICATPSASIRTGERSDSNRSQPHNSHCWVKTVVQVGAVQVYGQPDRRVAELATVQHGIVSHRQLLAIGLTRSMIESRRVSGWLLPMHRGVYAVGHGALPRFAREVAALLAMPASALLSHETAARLWGLHREPEPPSEIDVLVRGGGGRWRDGINERRTKLAWRLERSYANGLPVTTPEQTLIDLATRLAPRALERAVDEALASRLTTCSRLTAAATLSTHRAGAADVRTLVSEWRPSTITRAKAEEKFLSLIREAELPQPELDVPLYGFTVDFYWRELGLVVEVDGYQLHASKSAFERDRRKDAILRGNGLQLTRVTWDQIERQRLATTAMIASQIAALKQDQIPY
jgi:very-short-patch-repair endonuclease